MHNPSSNRRRVLVVDDEIVIRKLLSELLVEEDYEVKAAASGREALDVLRDWQPDLIVLDLVMPGMDAWAFRAAQRGLQRVAAVPVLILSAEHQALERVASLRAAAVLEKPFNVDEFVRTVARVIGAPGR